jgi:biopolymer transport protein ExbD
MKNSVLVSERRSPLLDTMSVKNGNSSKRSRGVKDLALALPLTSLIDAFSIIVIYLLIGTQTTGIETDVSKKIKLPTAEAGTTIDKEMAVLRIEHGQYFLKDQMIPKNLLAQKLEELKKQSTTPLELMIQADVNMEYADLDPLVRAGSEAGIEKLRFAVIPNQ